MALPYYNNNNYPLYNQPQYQQQTQMQTAGCMMVPTEEEVQKYPVAPNTAMVFLLQDPRCSMHPEYRNMCGMTKQILR